MQDMKKPSPIQVPTLVVAWLKEEFVLDPKGIVQKAKLYEAYEDFCKRQSLRPRPPNTFGKILRQIFPHIQTKRLGSHRCQVTYYEGLAPKGGSAVNLFVQKEELHQLPHHQQHHQQHQQHQPQHPQHPLTPKEELEHLHQLQQSLQQQQQLIEQTIQLHQLQQQHSQQSWLSSLTSDLPFTPLPVQHLQPQEPQLIPQQQQPSFFNTQQWPQPLPQVTITQPTSPIGGSLFSSSTLPRPAGLDNPNFNNTLNTLNPLNSFYSNNSGGNNSSTSTNGFRPPPFGQPMPLMREDSSEAMNVSDKDQNTSWEQLGRFLKMEHADEGDSMQDAGMEGVINYI